MKNLEYVLLGILLLSSCNPRAAKLQSRVNDTCHIEQYFHKFMSRFPNGTDNAIKLEEMNEVFVPEITDSLRKSEWLLSDFPIQFRGVKKYNTDKCYVHFQSWIKPHGFSFKDYDFNEFAFDIVAKMPLEKGVELKDDEFYIIHGKLIRFISHNEFGNYSDGMAYTPTVGIRKEKGFESYSINWHLGEMLFDIDSVSIYKENNSNGYGN